MIVVGFPGGARFVIDETNCFVAFIYQVNAVGFTGERNIVEKNRGGVAKISLGEKGFLEFIVRMIVLRGNNLPAVGEAVF